MEANLPFLFLLLIKRINKLESGEIPGRGGFQNFRTIT